MRVALVSYCRSESAYLYALSTRHDVALVVRSGDPNALTDRVVALGADLVVVAGCPARISPAFRDAARLGTVNFHPSLLPAYRGRDPVFWTILRGECTAGITAHRMTDEIDAGPVLLQQAIQIPERATSAMLSSQLDLLGADLAVQLCGMAERGGLPDGSAQTGAPSRFPPIRPEHGGIDWSRDARDVDRLVRACAGEIHAFTTWRGMKIVVLDAEPSVEASAAQPGTVLAIDAEGMRVAASFGHVVVRRFFFVERAFTAAELAAYVGLHDGARFDARPCALR